MYLECEASTALDATSSGVCGLWLHGWPQMAFAADIRYKGPFSADTLPFRGRFSKEFSHMLPRVVSIEARKGGGGIDIVQRIFLSLLYLVVSSLSSQAIEDMFVFEC